MKIDQDLIKNEIPYMIGAGLLMCLFCFTGQEIYSRIEGSIFLFFILLFVYMTVKKAIKGRNDQQVNQPKYSIWMSIVVSIIGLAFALVSRNVVCRFCKADCLVFWNERNACRLDHRFHRYIAAGACNIGCSRKKVIVILQSEMS